MARKPVQDPTPLDEALKSARPAILSAIVFSMFINILALVSPIYMMQVYDRVLSSRNTFTLLVITLVAVFLFLVYGFLEALRTQVLVRGGVRFDEHLRGTTFESVLRQSLQNQPQSVQAFRDVDTVREFTTGAGLIAFCDAPWVPIFVVISFLLHPFFGVLAIISGLIMLGLAVANDYVTRTSIQRATTAAIAAQNYATATLRNAEVMKAMGMWGGLQNRWQLRRDELISYQAAASDRGGGVMAAIKVFRQVVQTLILGGGAYLAIKGSISPGAMIGASILVGRALAPIEGAVGQWKPFIQSRSAWDRLQALFRDQPRLSEAMPLPPPKGLLSVESAAIIPPGAAKPSLFNTSFRVEPGRAIGIVGPSAAGKSTLVRGLVGVWPTVQGAIRLDGSDMKHWDPRQLGRHVGYLPQDVELFSGSVADNISRFGDVDPEAVVTAAQLAGCHELIQALPHGYETQIGEGGAALSGGQRQRIALARAVYKQPALIVLDEPNASLDAAGEAALIESVGKLKAAGSTVVFVTHKMNLLSAADSILVMQAGTVALHGPRDEVLRQLMGPAPSIAPQAAQRTS
ncbi:type I secretion system permease/ATPase [Phenylobacterium sp.]|jgi:ATP-binding cassette subfamily C protein RsaD|uniref:type I secretion system permease/ATPase n=1 Tax=Phenylobacterium sp. TaxID=1871053 RepID=UPI002F93A887